MNTEIIEAIKNKNLIEIFYDNELQIIKPYYYVNSLGNEILIAEQKENFLKEDEAYYKNYYLNKAVDLNVLVETFNDSKESNINFNKQLDEIWASL